MNLVVLIGRLTKDPKTKTVNGKTVAEFEIAVDRFTQGEVDYIHCVAWEKTADFAAKYYTKGMRVGVQGRFRSEQWEVGETKQSRIVVVVERAEFADGKKSDPEYNARGNQDVGENKSGSYKGGYE